MRRGPRRSARASAASRSTRRCLDTAGRLHRKCPAISPTVRGWSRSCASISRRRGPALARNTRSDRVTIRLHAAPAPGAL